MKLMLIMLALVPALPLLAAPVIFHVSDPVGPGETAVLFGGGLGDKVTAVGDQAPDYPVSGPSDMSAPTGRAWPAPQPLQVLQSSDLCAKVLIPADWGPGMYEVAIPGATSPIYLNRTTVWWWLGGENDTAFTGETLQIFGKNLGPKTRAWLMQGTKSVELPVVKADKYTASYTVPANLAPGKYDLYAHNGCGSERGFSAPLPVTVATRVPWPATQFNVRDYGATGDGATDDTSALQAALAAAAKNNGGVVFLPRGVYKITAGLSLPPQTTLRGESRESVWLMVPDDTPTFGAVLAGNHDFAIEDLSVVSQTARCLVTCPDVPIKGQYPPNQRPADEGYNVHLRHLRLDHVLFAHRVQGKDPRRMVENGGFTVGLVGHDMEMTDCEVVSPGQPLCLTGGRHSRIIGNHLQTGRNGWYRLDNAEEIDFENNTIEGRDLEGSYGGVQGKAYRLYFAGNHYGPAYGDEREALTFDTPYAPTWMGRVGTATGVTLTTANYDGSAKTWSPGALKGQVCFICYGTGLGQYIPIVDNTETTITLVHKWAIAPDATSHLAVRVNKSDVVITNNTFHDASVAVQLYAQSYGFIVDGNTSVRTGGMYAVNWDAGTARGRRFSTSYFNQWLNNDLAQGFIYQQGAFLYGVLGPTGNGSNLDPPTLPCLGNVMRNNQLRDNNRVGVFYFGPHPLTAPASSAGYFGRDNVIEGNTIADSPVGIEIYPLEKDTLLRKNTVKNCAVPLWDDGINTWIDPYERLSYQVQAASVLLLGAGGSLWQAAAAAHPQDATAALLAVLAGLHWEVDPRSPLLESLSDGAPGPAELRVTVHLEPWAAPLQVQAALELPAGWSAAPANAGQPAPGAVLTLRPGDTKIISCAATLPAAADTRRLTLLVTATLDKTPLTVRQTVDVSTRSVKDWLLIGPFPNASGQLPDSATLPAETRLNAQAEYDGLAGKIRWQQVSLPNRWLHLDAQLRPEKPATALAVCDLHADAATDAELHLSYIGAGTVWLNDALLATLPAGNNKRTFRVCLQAGDNLLVWKSSCTTDRGIWLIALDFTPLGAGDTVAIHALPAAQLAALPALNPAPPSATPTAAGALDHDAGVPWHLVYSDDFDRRLVGDKWKTAGGQWDLKDGVLVGAPESWLAYAAKVAPPVRIEYDARSASPHDLSCFWFRDPQDQSSGALIAYAAGESSRIQVDGFMLSSSDAPEARGVPNQWQHVIAQILLDGRIQLYADHRLILEARDTTPSRVAAYPGVWTWGGGEFKNVRIYTGAP